MQIIRHNPYRIVGLPIGATEREKQNQIKKLKMFLEAEQEPAEDFSLPVLGSLDRTVDSVTDAASKLNLDSDKMSAALFWFYKGNAITDEPAFDSLKEGDEQSSNVIWTKLTGVDEVNQRNSSAFQNLSTLLLCNAFNDSSINEKVFEQGISLKLKFLESDFVKDLKALATDTTYKTSKKELQLLFLNQVQHEVDKNGNITSNKFLEILNKQEFSAKEDFLKGFVQKSIEQVEKKIELSKVKRKANKATAANVGKDLYEQNADNLSQLKNISGASNIKFSSISDKVSDEILQCGIDYFSNYRDSNIDPGSLTMDLFRKANDLAIGNIAKQRCQENAKDLQRWIDNKPKRDKEISIKKDVDFIVKEIERDFSIQTVTKGIDNELEENYGIGLISNYLPTARNFNTVIGKGTGNEFADERLLEILHLIFLCESRIISIRDALGAGSLPYINLSSLIVNKALDGIINVINNPRNTTNNLHLSFKTDFDNDYKLASSIEFALSILYILERFHLSYQCEIRFEQTLHHITNFCRKLNIPTLRPKDLILKRLGDEENLIQEIQNKEIFEAELLIESEEMEKIKGWKLLRKRNQRENEINKQQNKIDTLRKKSSTEKNMRLKEARENLNYLKNRMSQLYYQKL